MAAIGVDEVGLRGQGDIVGERDLTFTLGNSECEREAIAIVGALDHLTRGHTWPLRNGIVCFVNQDDSSPRSIYRFDRCWF